jgi:hypothetical protein
MVSRRRKCDSSAWVPLFHRSEWKWHSPKFVLAIRGSAVLSDQQLRDASFEQLQDLIARVDLLLRSKGQPGLMLHPPEDEPETPEPADRSDPGTIGTE